ncbi:hypothetical protein ACQU0X_25750 [Pseudovibrio ascidiaceicola]|uniref:hypothetical protein n=1 Tax=Pseudovibrio ascidiaceicola TaxID=285279 RepID=UPI003D36FD26
MLFILLIVIFFFSSAATLWCWLFGLVGKSAGGDVHILQATIFVMFAMASGIPVAVVWSKTSDQIQSVEALDNKIALETRLVGSLKEQVPVSDFDLSIARKLSLKIMTAEEEIIRYSQEKATQISLLEQTYRGPMSGVFSVVGDYKQLKLNGNPLDEVVQIDR